MFAPDAELSFPGDNTWSRQHRPSQAGRAAFATHQGKAEIEAFLRRYVDNHIHMEVEDILVNGPPWKTRAAVRVHHWITGPDGNDLYSNRAVLMVRTAWGKIRSQEELRRHRASVGLRRQPSHHCRARHSVTPIFLPGATIDASVGAGDHRAVFPIAGPGRDNTLTDP